MRSGDTPCSTRRSRSGRGWATSTAWARPCGASASGTATGGDFVQAEAVLRPGRSRSSSGSAIRSGSAGRGSRARSRGCWHATCRPPRDDLAPTLREFWAGRDVSGLVLVLSAASRTLLLDRPSRRRWRTRSAAPRSRLVGRDRAAPRRRSWPSGGHPDRSTPTRPIRSCGPPFERGRAWSRDEAGGARWSRIDALAEAAQEVLRRRPERRTMAGVHAPDRLPAARARCPAPAHRRSTPRPASATDVEPDDPADLMLTCANCGARMDERKCKLICRCGYFLSCSDYY